MSGTRIAKYIAANPLHSSPPKMGVRIGLFYPELMGAFPDGSALPRNVSLDYGLSNPFLTVPIITQAAAAEAHDLTCRPEICTQAESNWRPAPRPMQQLCVLIVWQEI
jgi:hypothetical protein